MNSGSFYRNFVEYIPPIIKSVNKLQLMKRKILKGTQNVQVFDEKQILQCF